MDGDNGLLTGIGCGRSVGAGEAIDVATIVTILRGGGGGGGCQRIVSNADRRRCSDAIVVERAAQCELVAEAIVSQCFSFFGNICGRLRLTEQMIISTRGVSVVVRMHDGRHIVAGAVPPNGRRRPTMRLVAGGNGRRFCGRARRAVAVFGMMRLTTGTSVNGADAIAEDWVRRRFGGSSRCGIIVDDRSDGSRFNFGRSAIEYLLDQRAAARESRSVAAGCAR